MKNPFKKDNVKQDKEQIITGKKTRVRRGGYAVAFTAIALACVILINWLFYKLGDRVTLRYDLSLTGENSISEENEEFIKSIDREVSLTVCAPEADYAEQLDYYAANYYYVYDESGYYEQTLNLINFYGELNSNIKVEYIDLTSTVGSAIVNEFPSLFYGDIIVRAANNEGKTNSKLVGYDDIYSYSDSTGYGYYYSVTSNKLETALSSAINTVVSGATKNAAILSSCSETDVFETLFGSNLKLNSFEITEIEDNIINSISAEIDQLYIVYPTRDLLPDEISALNTWLYNGGERGKSLLFVPGTSVANTPNLNEFLKEWGISYSDGILFETSSSKHLSKSPTTLQAFNNTTTISGVLEADKYFILGNNLPMTAAYETYSTKTTNVMVSTSDTVVAAPLGIDENNWEPTSDYEKGSYANLIITKDSDVVGDDLKTSYVAAFSSYDFIYSQWAQTSQIANMTTAINTASFTAGFDNDAKMIFVDKTVTVENFADSISENEAVSIRIIFMGIVPAILIVSGVVIWYRRRVR